MKIYTTMDSPLGELLVMGERSPAGVVLTGLTFAPANRAEGRHDGAAFAEAERELREYFAGERTEFEVAHSSRGTSFQERVWAAVEAIPYGTTTTYGAIAERVGAPADRIRAVAATIGANPLLIVRPCHRVVGSGGSLTGYAGGIERKCHLLAHEGARQPQLF